MVIGQFFPFNKMYLLRKSILRGFSKPMKIIETESYLQTQKDTKKHVKMSQSDLKKISREYNQDTAQRELPENFVPIPVSHSLYPIEVSKLEIGEKYKWCSCGMSLAQPFCDQSHNKTKFAPLTFIIEEPIHSVLLCACKYSTAKPFCDQKTCAELRNQTKV